MKVILKTKTDQIEIENNVYKRMTTNFLVIALSIVLSYIFLFFQISKSFEANISFVDMLSTVFDPYLFVGYSIITGFICIFVGVAVFYYIKGRSQIVVDLGLLTEKMYYKNQETTSYKGFLPSLYSMFAYKLLYINNEKISVNEKTFEAIKNFLAKTGNESLLQKMDFKTEAKHELQEFKESLLFFKRKKNRS